MQAAMVSIGVVEVAAADVEWSAKEGAGLTSSLARFFS